MLYFFQVSNKQSQGTLGVKTVLKLNMGMLK